MKRAFDTIRQGQRHFARAECPQCGGHDDIPLSTDLPPDVIAKKFRQKGWRVGGPSRDPKPILCPTCVEKRSSRPSGGAMEVIDKMASNETAPANIQRIRMKAGALIMDNWSEQRGRYSEGWSDERVSKETGLSEQAVKRMREQDLDFKRKVPKEIEDCETEIAALFDRLSVLETKVREIREKHEAA